MFPIRSGNIDSSAVHTGLSLASLRREGYAFLNRLDVIS